MLEAGQTLNAGYADGSGVSGDEYVLYELPWPAATAPPAPANGDYYVMTGNPPAGISVYAPRSTTSVATLGPPPAPSPGTSDKSQPMLFDHARTLYVETGGDTVAGLVSVYPPGYATLARVLAAGGGGIAVDGKNHLYVADRATEKIYAFAAGATSPSRILTVPGTKATLYPVYLAADLVGDLYVTMSAGGINYEFPAGSSQAIRLATSGGVPAGGVGCTCLVVDPDYDLILEGAFFEFGATLPTPFSVPRTLSEGVDAARTLFAAPDFDTNQFSEFELDRPAFARQ